MFQVNIYREIACVGHRVAASITWTAIVEVNIDVFFLTGLESFWFFFHHETHAQKQFGYLYFTNGVGYVFEFVC